MRFPSGSRQSDDGANPGSAHQTIHHAMFIIWEFFIREMDLMLCGGKVLPTHYHARFLQSRAEACMLSNTRCV